MRRRITLYVGGRKADLNDQSFILYNYTAEDLSNPTVVKNSFSKQVTLPGTCRNNRIFGHTGRLDRVISALGFNPARRTDFSLCDEAGNVIESGYLKLDEVVRTGRWDVSYKVTLYGGLGGFLYNLSYNEDGTKKTLADLDWLGGGETELDFDINAATVADAWDALRYGTAEGTKWGVVNFFPAYNGIPDNFDAKHALATAADCGLPYPLNDSDGNACNPSSGYALVDLGDSFDEWAVKDLRSYLQRPAFSMRALMDAVADAANNGGYEFDYSDLSAGAVMVNPAMYWVTRPMLSALVTNQETGADLTAAFSSNGNSSTPAQVSISGVGDLSSGTEVTARLSLTWRVQESTSGAASLYLRRDRGLLPSSNVVLFLQAVGYNSNSDPVGASDVVVVCNTFGTVAYDGQTLADLCGYTPPRDASYQTPVGGQFDYDADNKYLFSRTLGLAVSGVGMTSVQVKASLYEISYLRNGQNVNLVSASALNYCNPKVWDASGDEYSTTNGTMIEAQSTVVTAAQPSSIRSGAHFTKRMLLSTGKTPADYLLAFAKTFGLSFVYDKATRRVSLVRRNSLYVDETIDLSGRIDKSQPMTIVPLAFTARWYDFLHAPVGGAFMDEYKKVYGREYGIQRVNTGYDFDANSVDLLSGCAFKSAAAVLEHGPYWFDVTEGGDFRPAVFLNVGMEYTLWASNGKGTAFPVPGLSSSAVITEMNEYNPGYDAASTARYVYHKMQFHDASGKPVNGEDVLGMVVGWMSYGEYKLTDDLSIMDSVNEGKPCWILDEGAGVSAPQLTRYDIDLDTFLDFGVPAEVDIPRYAYDGDDTIYAKCWRNYIRDRYDKDTKVMTCKVDLSGLQVGQDLLRRFFWYENSLWTLNKITNHSLTTYGPTECEFVQVRDKDNYLNGQN